MLKELEPFLNKPPLYTSSTNQFWNDDHISRYVLDSHLNPDEDAASRNPVFTDRSVSWIASIAPPYRYTTLLDLGCGPGLYAERFSRAGYTVTGIDFSTRSISYAKEQTAIHNSGIKYFYQDYLSINYDNCFDLITLIYCDFGVLSAVDRALLLDKVYKGLKSGGKFILDVFTPAQHQGKKEACDWRYHPDGGFWDKQPHLCLNSFYRYDEDNTILNQTIVANENGVECYNIWEHCFTKDALLLEAQTAVFTQYKLYGDVSGKAYDGQGNIICAVFTK